MAKGRWTVPGEAWKKSLKNPKQYEALRKKGESKSKAARISNSAAAAADDLELTLIATPAQSLTSVGLGYLTLFSDRSEVSEEQSLAIRELRSPSKRRELAKSDNAQSDGSFPIPDVLHLKKALRAFSRSSNKGKTKRWIIRKARTLRATQYLPEGWGVKNTVGSRGNSTRTITAGIDSDSNGTMVAAFPPPDVAAKLATGEEGDHAAEDLHVTLAYFGDNLSDTDLEALRQAVFEVVSNQEQPLSAAATEPGTFDSPEGDNPRIYRVQSPGLKELRDSIVSAAEKYGLEPNTEHDFTPHITARYGGEPLQSVPDGGNAPWPIDAVGIKHKSTVDIQPFGHDFVDLADGEDSDSGYCELCSRPAESPVHENEPVPSYLDDMQEGSESDSAANINIHDEKPASEFNWVEDAGGLPPAIKEVEKAIRRGGAKGESHAIAIAVSRAKRWATTSKNAKTRAKYAEAVAQWEAMKAKAHADDVSVASGAVILTSYPFEVFDAELIEPNGDRVSVLDLEEGRMATNVVASASAWTDGGSFYWNDETNDVYSVDDAGAISQFVSRGGEDAGMWEVRPDMSVADVESFPTVDDPDTLEAITAAGEGETPDIAEEAGQRFAIDLVIPEGVPSGDTRSFSEGALEFLEPPFPLFWQKMSGEGHNNSVAVGKFTKIERTEAGLGRAEGVFDTSEDAIEAARQVKAEILLGVSGDVDQFKAEMSTDETGEELIDIKHGRLVGATLVGKPAFQECRIKLVDENGEENEAMTASGGPLKPPAEWFKNPELSAPTRLVVEDGGRVYGHIATWGTPHTGNPALQPPHSNTNYKFFRTGNVLTAEGFNVDVGHLTLAGGHAGLNMSADRAVQHYDDTKSSVADVACGEDKFGIWVAGTVRPGVSDEQVYAFRASAPSGDWRKLDNNLELVAICQVNTPGFPVPKTLVASGETMALVAAGALTMPEPMVPTQPTVDMSALESRIAELETFVYETKEAAVRERVEAAVASLRN